MKLKKIDSKKNMVESRMINHQVFSIPRNILSNLPEGDTWEEYDEECSRADIKLNDDILDKILSYSNTNLNRNEKRYTVHKVKYSTEYSNNDYYSISEHEDNCRFTIIIYLKKSPQIRDEFWVGEHKVKANLWSKNPNTFKGLIFWGNSPHKGKIFGKGKRDIICFFCD